MLGCPTNSIYLCCCHVHCWILKPKMKVLTKEYCYIHSQLHWTYFVKSYIDDYVSKSVIFKGNSKGICAEGELNLCSLAKNIKMFIRIFVSWRKNYFDSVMINDLFETSSLKNVILMTKYFLYSFALRLLWVGIDAGTDVFTQFVMT